MYPRGTCLFSIIVPAFIIMNPFALITIAIQIVTVAFFSTGTALNLLHLMFSEKGVKTQFMG